LLFSCIFPKAAWKRIPNHFKRVRVGSVTKHTVKNALQVNGLLGANARLRAVKTVINPEPDSFTGRHLVVRPVHAGISQQRSGDPVIGFVTTVGRLIDGPASVH